MIKVKDWWLKTLILMQSESKLKAIHDLKNGELFPEDVMSKYVVSYKVVANEKIRNLQIVVEGRDAASAKNAAIEKLRKVCPDGFQIGQVSEFTSD